MKLFFSLIVGINKYVSMQSAMWILYLAFGGGFIFASDMNFDPPSPRYHQVNWGNRALKQVHEFYALLGKELQESKRFSGQFPTNLLSSVEKINPSSYVLLSQNYTIGSNQDLTLTTSTMKLSDVQESHQETHRFYFQLDARRQLKLQEFLLVERVPNHLATQIQAIPNLNAVVALVYQWVILMDSLEEKMAPFTANYFNEDSEIIIYGKKLDNNNLFNRTMVQKANNLRFSSHIIDNIQASLHSPDIIEISFELDWRGLDHLSNTHVSRSEWNWQVEVNESGKIIIKKVLGKRLLPLIDTGTRIRC